jgi:hypothetical protein
MRRTLCFALTGLLTVVLACSDRSPTSPEKARLPPGMWGSDAASMTIKEGGAGANVEILALALPPCFGSYGDISQEIPNGPFSLAGTYTQLTGVYPGRREYPAQFSGVVEGTRMTLTITVSGLPLVLGPFVLTYGVTNAWEPCRYP